MKSLFIGTLVVAGFVGFAPLAYATGPGCVPPGAALAHAQMVTSSAGGVAVQLGGDQAEDFLDYVNDHVGHSTDLWGQGVLVERFPALGFDTIAIIDDGCVDEAKALRLDPATTDLALQASQHAFD
ncbi:MAG TPA: hypothetical protein VKV77_11800 [Methylovirgula sp.]|nr:hypothetical protein [Methylovirgula sp.]